MDLLFPEGQQPKRGEADTVSSEPSYFHDLNLDQVVDGITAGRSRHHLTPEFWTPIRDLDILAYRHEVFDDLFRSDIGSVVRSFTQRRLVYQFQTRTNEIRDDDHGLQHHYRTRFFLNAVEEYCQATLDLCHGLEVAGAGSRALRGLTRYLQGYVRSSTFQTLKTQAQIIHTALSDIHYVIVIRGDKITVAPYDGEADYGAQVIGTFQRFQQPSTTAREAQGHGWDAYSGTGVLDLVAQLFPQPFADLNDFCERNAGYLDPVIARFDRDIQFYLAYLDFIAPMQAAGLAFSLPHLSITDKNESALDTFDLALAHRIVRSSARLKAPELSVDRLESATEHSKPQVVTNDITLMDAERILVISGPNNGGKTTLARTFGQLHHLARLGCPVPGRGTRLYVCDKIFTHFGRIEDSHTQTGRLQDELTRLRGDLSNATPDSLLILNETFSSTTAHDALFLSRMVLEQIADLDAICACVTFLDELSTMNSKTVSMVSTVDPMDPATRTHRVLRRPADGRAYARAIADKYGLGFDHLVRELSR